MNPTFRFLLAIAIVIGAVIVFGLAVGSNEDSGPCGKYTSQNAVDFCAENLP